MVLVFVSKNAVAINLAIKNRVNPDFLDVVARSNQIETLNLLIYMTYIGAKKKHKQWHQCKPQQNDLWIPLNISKLCYAYVYRVIWCKTKCLWNQFARIRISDVNIQNIPKTFDLKFKDSGFNVEPFHGVSRISRETPPPTTFQISMDIPPNQRG